ncbi:epoxide hydrolase family protein [Sphingobium cupriresistens]|uniref:Epoxide hydrolase n=2 Tax=Sphingobium cupriresistens TaxID=1132417 RepID=A0A0J7XPN8_9SPHN|nr:epoxide hydrolase family protein [Sphingobium cupriresistens]KMS53003.1 epoxide hydrolase [Sphingobium cupriresistens LL01]RYM11961.1 epoxide hydrolase [Sphingobium cupriresistens]
MSDSITPFTVAVPQDALDDLHQRISNTRWPATETVTDWSQGAPIAAMRDLCAYWANGYDWRRCEAALNALPQFMTQIDGLSIHFLHVRSPRPDAVPLILTHGWPGSVLEFMKVIGPLSNPAPDAPAFHLVIPSLPGYGFSDKPAATGWGVEKIADAWITLMRRLGYDRFFAQGGDWGAAVTTAIAMAAPPELAGIHLNMPLVFPEAGDFADLTPAEARTVERMQYYQDHDAGYAKLQGTRPQTIGYALADSPVGQAAWIYEKFQAWTDNEGAAEDALSRDEMLDIINLYWLTNSAASSGRLYWESAGAFKAQRLDLPVGVSIFAQEIFRPSRRWAERSYPDLVHWNELPVGGHFAAFEQPDLFAAELRACFGAMQART